jgi:hypothetical protein
MLALSLLLQASRYPEDLWGRRSYEYAEVSGFGLAPHQAFTRPIEILIGPLRCNLDQLEALLLIIVSRSTEKTEFWFRHRRLSLFDIDGKLPG